MTLLKNKIHPSKLEDLIDFIKQFMSGAAFPLASRGDLRNRTKWEVFIDKKVREVISKKEGIVSVKITFC